MRKKQDFDERFMTVVFDVQGVDPPNPFRTASVFGTAVGVSIGDVMDVEFMLREAVEYAISRRDIDWLEGWLEGDAAAAADLTRHMGIETDAPAALTPEN